MSDETMNSPEPQPEPQRKRGRPASHPVAAGKRGAMKDGIRRYVSKDGLSVSYQVKVSTFDRDTGKRRSSIQTFATKAEAEQVRNSLRKDRDKGRMVLPSNIQVAEWVTSRATGYQGAATSREVYMRYAKRIAEAFPATRLQDVTPVMVEHFRDAMVPILARRTRKAVLVFFKSACREAVEKKLIRRSPFEGVKLPKDRDEVTPDGEAPAEELKVKPEQIGRLLDHLDGSEFRLPCMVLAMTGMRRGELCALRWRHVDLARATIDILGTVQATKKSEGRGTDLAVAQPKTKAGKRKITIGPALVAELKRHKAEQAALGLRLGAREAPDWLLFPRVPEEFTALRDPAVLATGLRWRLRKTEFADLTPHDLRHTFASKCLSDGKSVKAVAAYLGHTTKVLLDTYAHLLDRDRNLGADFERAVPQSAIEGVTALSGN